jgi:hypothetical protein
MSLFVARTGETIGVWKVWVGKREGNKPLGRPRCRWENNVKMDLRKIRIALGLD